MGVLFLVLRSVDEVNLYFSTYWSRNIPATSMVFHSVLSGHVIFQLLFRPILHSFLEHSSSYFTNVPLMTL